MTIVYILSAIVLIMAIICYVGSIEENKRSQKEAIEIKKFLKERGITGQGIARGMELRLTEEFKKSRQTKA